MKSKTVKFNVFQLLTTLALATAAYLSFSDLPQWLFVSLSVLSIVVSQAIGFFTPSGEFIGHGQNWSVGKWITRVGLAVIAMFELYQNSLGGVMVISILTPIIEIIIRVYGSATESQKAAALK